ncbi:hypothetical protein D9611_000241 [Ephemerocybe angulata]|uniref:DASH complex subunit DUO1 n=1 Tax=Ephemerocybe angulata TaxID=980116 RepID=A0A8H5BMN6_9AGAR|nr:hypothetical protein D9611_000241 [Tulosesus angulatus]
MDDSYNSSANFSLGNEGSQLLDLSDVLPPDSSHSGQHDEHHDDGGDLSLSDLSLDHTIRGRAPFSLLSQPKPEPPQPLRQQQKGKAPSSSRLIDPEDDPDASQEYEDEGIEGESFEHEGEQAEQAEGEEEQFDEALEEERQAAKRRAEKLREEKLQNDIFILKKLNAAFETFNGALDEAGAANHKRVAEQLVETDRLLNKYVRILSKSEDFARLIFDEEWHGAEADEEQIRLEQLAAEQREREAARERALAEQRERERQEREERERGAREEKERLEREKKERLSSRGGVRGVRGTRASMRGMRTAPPSSRPESSTATRSRVSVAPGTTGIPVKRGTTTSSRGLGSRRP